MRRIFLVGFISLLAVGSVYADWGMWDLNRRWIAIDTGATSDWYSLWDGGAGTYEGAFLGVYTASDTFTIDA